MSTLEPKRTESQAILVYYGLVGSNNNTSKPYRPDNPWQALGNYFGNMPLPARTALGIGSVTRWVDRGGSVWRIELIGKVPAEKVARDIASAVQREARLIPGDRVTIVVPASATTLVEFVVDPAAQAAAAAPLQPAMATPAAQASSPSASGTGP